MLERKITFMISDEEHQKTRGNLPWGVQGLLLRNLLRIIVEAVERDGKIIIGAILSGDIELRLAKKDESRKTS